MKIAIASLGNPEAVSTWSGIPSYIIKALKSKGHSVIYIALQSPEEPWYFNWFRRVYYRVQKRWFYSLVEKKILKEICCQFDNEVEKSQPDIVLSIHGDWLSYVTFKQPACILHDATFASLVNYYPAFTNLTARSVRLGNEMYKRALQRADAAIFSSRWASSSAIDYYEMPLERVHTIPLGANLTDTPETKVVKQWITERAENSVCKLLFLGIDWERKGGPDALRFVAELNRQGIKSQLTIVGCLPEIPENMAHLVYCMGFLRKDVAEESLKLRLLLQDSNALILLSQAECYGCVYCEANAYGLPALGRETGGVSEIIKEGVNGLLFNLNDSPESFACRWATYWTNRQLYIDLSVNARTEFEERLNYTVFTEELENVFVDLLKKIEKQTLIR